VYTYNAYGLGVHSSLPLPELTSLAEVEPDILITTGRLDRPPSNPDTPNTYTDFTADEAYLFWNNLGAFLIRGGKEIIIDPFPDVEERLIRLPLLGTVLGILLHQRGLLVLHASAIAIADEAVVFVGAKGLGKSTTAAALYARGHELIADDVVAIDMSDPRSPVVIPGFPQMKLWPESLSALGDDPSLLPQLADGYDKRARHITERFARKRLPLKYIFALSRGDQASLKPASLQEAVTQVIAHSYVSRYGEQLLNGAQAASHLLQSTSLLRNVPVYFLQRSDSLSMLPATVGLIEDHLRQSMAAG